MIIDYGKQTQDALAMANTLDDLEYFISKNPDLNEDQKTMLNRSFLYLQDEINVLDFDALKKINEYARMEDKKVKSDIQANIRLFKRTHNESIKQFLIRYLRKKDPSYLFKTQEYIDLG